MDDAGTEGRRRAKVALCVLVAVVSTSAFAQESSSELTGTFIRKGNAFAALDYPKAIDPAQLSSVLEEGTIKDVSVSADRGAISHKGKHYTIQSTYAKKVEKKKFEEVSGLNYEFNDSRLGEVNVAAWINQTTDKLKSYNLLTKKSMSVNVDAQCKDMANAHFNSAKNEICLGHLFESKGRDAFFGAGGAAWDADVVAHEFGHAVFFHLGTLPRGEGARFISLGNDQIGAINEGQADYQAYTSTGNVKLAPWFMHVVTDGQEEFLRRVDNSLRLDKNAFGEIHDDGQLFAGVLYSLSQAVGVSVATKLWFHAIPKIGEMDNMHDMSRHILQADEALNSGKNRAAIVKAFTSRGMMGQQEIDAENISVALKVTDDADALSKLQYQLFSAFGVLLPIGSKEPNNNGKLEAGECAIIDIMLRNQAAHNLVGVEVFAPETGLPAGATSLLANRFYMGIVKGGHYFPTSLEPKNIRRPWVYICAEKNYAGGDIQFIVRNASYKQVTVKTSLETSSDLPKVNGWVNPTPTSQPAAPTSQPTTQPTSAPSGDEV